MDESPPRTNPAIALLVILTIVFAASFVGHLGTIRGAGEWYMALARPTWAPPVCALGLVPLAVAGCLGIAIWRVWRVGAMAGKRLWAVAVLLILMALWPWLLFSAQRPAIALVGLLALLIMSGIAVRLLNRSQPGSGWLLLPLLLWSLYCALAVTFLWRMNV
jgi:translocator protein